MIFKTSPCFPVGNLVSLGVNDSHEQRRRTIHETHHNETTPEKDPADQRLPSPEEKVSHHFYLFRHKQNLKKRSIISYTLHRSVPVLVCVSTHKLDAELRLLLQSKPRAIFLLCCLCALKRVANSQSLLSQRLQQSIETL